MAKVTLKDIAQHAKVSPSTVSLVLRDSPLVADSTRAEVRKVMAELEYVYNRSAANLRANTQRSRTIGVLVSEITNPFYAEFVAGIDSFLDEAGWLAFIANSAESPERQDRFIRRIREQGVDGIILAAAEGTSPDVLERLKRWDVPCVQSLRRIGTEPTDYVAPDYKLGVTLAVEHLVERGHSNIAYIGGARRTSATRERLTGFRKALSRHGIEPGPHVACPATREAGMNAVIDLLKKPNPPTAAICYNDIVAFGVILGVLDAGIQPGSDFGIIGFDNISEAALSRPALTTIAVDPHQIGEETAKLALRRIASPNGPHEQIILPPKLVIRET